MDAGVDNIRLMEMTAYFNKPLLEACHCWSGFMCNNSGKLTNGRMCSISRVSNGNTDGSKPLETTWMANDCTRDLTQTVEILRMNS